MDTYYEVVFLKFPFEGLDLQINDLGEDNSVV